VGGASLENYEDRLVVWLLTRLWYGTHIK
jgi:hypothetical protein